MIKKKKITLKKHTHIKMHDIVANLPLPSEIVYHLIVPFIPFVELTSEKIHLQRQRMKLWSRIQEFLNVYNLSVRRDILENYNDFDALEYVYDQSNLFLYISFSTSELNSIDDYFAIMF